MTEGLCDALAYVRKFGYAAGCRDGCAPRPQVLYIPTAALLVTVIARTLKSLLDRYFGFLQCGRQHTFSYAEENFEGYLSLGWFLVLWQ
jgi:hypothetical protein